MASTAPSEAVDGRPGDGGDGGRAKRLADYKELLEGLEEMLVMQSEDDDEIQLLVADAQAQLTALAQSLNEEETIDVTPGLTKLPVQQEQPSLLNDDHTMTSQQNTNGYVIRYPPSDDPTRAAPYEVFYDEREWLPCVIASVIPPPTAVDRIQYAAYILGYNVEEIVTSDNLRPWDAAEVSGLTSQLRSGAVCHAIAPATGAFAPATVERLTLEGTVLVTFADRSAVASVSKDRARTENGKALSSDGGGEGEAVKEGEKTDSASLTVELPLSHVRVGKVYAQLRKRPQLTDEERAARRLENARKKRERAEMEKQLKADQVAQDANDWQSLMGDMMGVGGAKKKKRRV